MYETELEITELIRIELYSSMRYLALALGMLQTGFSENIVKAGTDGERVIFRPEWLTACFLDLSPEPKIFLLHQLYHCLLLHPFTKPPLPEGSDKKVDPDLWNLSCDLIVWSLIHQTYSQHLPPDMAVLAGEAAEICGSLTDIPSAAALYRLLKSKYPDPDAKRFHQDDHSMWMFSQDRTKMRKHIKFAGPGNSEDEDGPDRRWRDISRKTRFPLPSGRKKKGSEIKNLSKAVTLGESRRWPYADFLRRFCVLREDIRPNMDEFQYAYYIYGLDRYGNVPIIEPLEYTEMSRIYDLAIVIDTSASCSRDLTQMFLEETRNIIISENLFFSRFNLHIIQCDNAVRRDDRITSLDEFKDYIRNLEITGHGGTDYRPAFDYIDGLVQNGDLMHLKGIMYFTDGYGMYPDKIPAYETAFVFFRHRYDDIDVPDWAVKLVLDADMPKG